MKECRFCDLDCTLIFSHRYEIGEKIVVEFLKEKEQSYMQKHIYEMFKEVGKNIIPLTSRTITQYNRIAFPTMPGYALIDNGGILLVNGKIDEDWKNETIRSTSDDINNMKLIEARLSNYGEIIWQDGLVIFLKLRNEEDTNDVIDLVKEYDLLFFEHGSKKYICSMFMNKGMAVKRFKEKFQVKTTYMAGDSMVDYATAPYVDELFLSKDLEKLLPYSANVSYWDKLELADKIMRG
jgi:hypothetical protein